jgi:hypothetical protein
VTLNAALGLVGIGMIFLAFCVRGRERMLAILAALTAFAGIGATP